MDAASQKTITTNASSSAVADGEEGVVQDMSLSDRMALMDKEMGREAVDDSAGLSCLAPCPRPASPHPAPTKHSPARPCASHG